MNSRMDQLEQSAADYRDEPAESWKPKPGDMVVGTVRAIDVRGTSYDPAVPVLELETPEGSRVAVWAFHTVLRNELKRLAVQVGDEVAIRRLEDSAKGYKRYRVFTPDEQVNEFSWDSVSTDGGDVDPDDQEEVLAPPGETHADEDDEPISEADDDLPF